jgi:photosystem II stability/assembly factor-like uncharacterized protein
LAAILMATTAQLGCKVCECQVPPETPAAAATTAGAATAAASPSSQPAATTNGGGLTGSVGYKWKNVVILGGGFVTGVVFSPIEKDLVYIRTDVGGAYRWDPKDKVWVAMEDFVGRDDSPMGIESLAADPVDANKVYMTTGMYTGSWVGNGALMRSKDRGASWETIEMPMKMGGNENGRSMGERLAIDPNLTSTLYFGSRKDGLWTSTDSGSTWRKVDSFTASDGGKAIGIPIVLFDKASGTKGKPTPGIYVAVANNDGGLYHTSDAGKTWKPIAKQPKGLMASHMEFDRDGEIYISFGNGPGPNDVTDGAVYKYQPKQEKFTNITPIEPKGEDKFGYGGLSVDAQHDDNVTVTTIDRWGAHDEMFRTTDGGKTWKAVFKKAVRDDAGAKYLYWHKPNEPMGFGWMGDVAIDPFNPGRVMYVTGQGLWASDDATAADTDKPTHWKFLDQGLEETAIQGLVSPPAGPPLLSVMGDLCGFRHDDLAAPPADGMFANPVCSTATSIDIGWGAPNVVARVGYPGWDGKGAFGAYSLDEGKTWAPFKTEPAGKGGGSIVVSADGTTFLWAPRDGNVVVSADHGATWTKVEGLPAAETSPDWAPVPFRPAADRVNAKKFYVLDAKGGQAYTSTDGGAHFTASPTGLPNLADYQYNAASAQATPGIEGDVWLTNFKELNHSTDSGKTFESIGGVTEAYALGFGKAPEGKKYPALYLIGKLGDVYGFFRSDDAGATWVRINDDKHQYGFSRIITGDPRIYGRVYFGAGGRGIVYGDPK